MRAITKALNTYRRDKREYITELVSVRREIEYLLSLIEQSSHRPAMADLREKAMLIKRALQQAAPPPLPDELCKPYVRTRRPAEGERIRELVRRHGGRRAKT